MPVNAGLAHLSDTLFTTAIALYSLALISYCGEYAFGRRGRVARTASAPARVLVPAGVPASRVPASRVPASGGAVSGVSASRADLDEVHLMAGLEGSVSSRSANGGVAGVGADTSGRSAGGGSAGGGSASGGSASGGSASGDWGGEGAGGTGTASAGGGRPRAAEAVGRLAVLLTLLGAASHLASIVQRGVAVDRIPWGNMYEFSSAVGFVAVTAFCVVLLRQPRIRYLGMFVMLPVILLMFLAGTVLYAKAAPLVPALRSYWLVIHVTAAITATGIFLVSFVATVLYLIRERYDRLVAAGVTSVRFPASLGSRLPESAVLDQVAYRTVAFGFPVWTFAIAAGAMWAEAAWGRYWGWDPKETWSFIAWVIYAAYLHARATAGWKGVKAARINLLAYSAMTFNFFVVNIVVAGLHSYAGLS